MATLFGGLLIGLSLGLLGSGGSIITVPVLVYGLGHPERVAIAESLFIVGAIALLGSIHYIRDKRVSWPSVLQFGVPGMGGTYIGAVSASFVSATVQLLVFGVIMLAAAVLMLRRPNDASPDARKDHPLILILAEGMLVGVITGFVGVGGGFLIVPALVFLRRIPIHSAIGTSLVIIAMNSTVGAIKYLGLLRLERLSIDWTTVAAFVALGFVGTVVGSRLNRLLNPLLLRRVFAVILVVIATLILLKEGRAISLHSYSTAAGSRASAAVKRVTMSP